MVILVPLAPMLVDSLLIINITISLLVLMRAASVTRPLDFSVFPSLLLVVTFARLSLNIATTRLILGNAAEGPLAAGKVVQTFGSFVGGDNLVVGFVIFTVIVLVQFVVITRGATRVSEVAARFQLDAMPGKQMSIDGDLAAGLIDQESASERRQEVGREADFYGSMDGASKFVRGDAVAGIVIMLVNIIGGLGIGMIYHGMSAAGALEVFGRLTIGDGLVSQVPALMVSIAAALLVTRSAASEQLSIDLGRQVFSSDWILFTAAIFLW
ncbi:MAG: flagellar biosynthesis protein FlhA, partial [Planctomycetes bacterium]|nr:flagellar biosynthesis protein FlhA [Planctomycetota bacterium]